MFTGATKIVKPEGQEADEFEQTVAQELFNLEVRPRRHSFLFTVLCGCAGGGELRRQSLQCTHPRGGPLCPRCFSASRHYQTTAREMDAHTHTDDASCS